jgi:hypothetical protein
VIVVEVLVVWSTVPVAAIGALGGIVVVVGGVVVGGVVPVWPDGPDGPLTSNVRSWAPTPVVPEGLLLLGLELGELLLGELELGVPEVLLPEVTVAEEDAGQLRRRSEASWAFASASVVVSDFTVASAASSVEALSGFASAAALLSAALSAVTFSSSACIAACASVMVDASVPVGSATV